MPSESKVLAAAVVGSSGSDGDALSWLQQDVLMDARGYFACLATLFLAPGSNGSM